MERVIYLLLLLNLQKTQATHEKRDVINEVPAPALNIPTRHTFTEYHNRIPVPVPQPIPISVPRLYPVSVPVGVPVDRPRAVPVIVPHPVAHIIPRPIAVPIDRPFPYPVPHPVPITITQGVGIPIPQPYAVGYPSPVPIRIPHPVPIAVNTGHHYSEVGSPAVVEEHADYSESVVESHGNEVDHYHSY